MWVEDLEEMVDTALKRKTIKGGFANAGIVPLCPDVVLDHLPDNVPLFLQQTDISRKTTLFDISNKVVTGQCVLDQWKTNSI
jgi:hypothetical protein